MKRKKIDQEAAMIFLETPALWPLIIPIIISVMMYKSVNKNLIIPIKEHLKEMEEQKMKKQS